MRCAMPQPCIGSSCSVFRISMSSVPCTNPVDLSAIGQSLLSTTQRNIVTLTLDCQETDTRVRGELLHNRRKVWNRARKQPHQKQDQHRVHAQLQQSKAH